MVTYKHRKLVGKVDGQDVYDVEAYGLSTDEKPMGGIANGSLFVEMDTGAMFFYDGESKSWLRWGT